LPLALPFIIIFGVNTLNRLEKLVERLIEGPFDRLFRTRLHPADLAKALALAMEEGRIADGRGGCIAPNHYQVTLNADDYQALQGKSNVIDEVEAIKRYLSGLMAETGCSILGTLQVSVQPRKEVEPGQIRVTSHHLSPPQTPDPHQPENGDTKQIQRRAYPPADRWQLCLPDREIKLGMPIVRIGRDPNNDVTILDQTVSRYHAQLRWRNGIYYVQNLSRTQPLGLNHRPIEGSAPLSSGDTLQLGQVILRIELTS
jgi:hypothetical protein